MRRLLCALLVAGGCAACTSPATPQPTSTPTPRIQQFAAGTCRSAAGNILALGDIARRLTGQATVPVADQTALRTYQKSLIRILPTANPATRQPLQDLITAIGFVRIRVDSNNYQPALMNDMAQAQASVQSACLH